jgi:hypothetical protein
VGVPEAGAELVTSEWRVEVEEKKPQRSQRVLRFRERKARGRDERNVRDVFAMYAERVQK